MRRLYREGNGGRREHIRLIVYVINSRMNGYYVQEANLIHGHSMKKTRRDTEGQKLYYDVVRSQTEVAPTRSWLITIHAELARLIAKGTISCWVQVNKFDRIDSIGFG